MITYNAPIDDMIFLFEKLRDNKYYNETRKIMNEAGVPGVIDEVISLRTGFKNNQQVYSIFSQVIDADINDSYKSGYDSRFSTKQHKVRNLIADKPEGWQKEIDDLVKTHEGNYKKMKTKRESRN